MKIPPLRFLEDGWVFNPFHWMGPDCRIDCYPDKLFHLLAGFAIAAVLAWADRSRNGRIAHPWVHVLVVPLVATAKELSDGLLPRPPDEFWRDAGPSWRDAVATLLGQALFWATVLARAGLRARADRRRGAAAAPRP